MRRGSKPLPIPAFLVVAVALSLAYAVPGALRNAEIHDGFLWDLDYYREAAAAWSAGADPYTEGRSPSGYYYTPIVTPLVARVFLGFEAETPYAVLAGIAIGAALWLALLAARPPAGSAHLCWLYALAFAGAEVIYVLATGNLAWLVGLLLAGALLAASRRSWPLFYLLVGLASLLKPYSLALLVVPLALGELSAWSVFALAPLAIDSVVSRLLWPGLAESRLEAIWSGILEPLNLYYSLAGRLSRLLGDLGLEAWSATAIAYGAQLAVAALLLLQVRRRRKALAGRAFALAVVAAFAVVPRMGGYDAYIFGPAIFAAFWTARGQIRPRAATIVGLLAVGVGLLKDGLAALPLVALAALLVDEQQTPAADPELSVPSGSA